VNASASANLVQSFAMKRAATPFRCTVLRDDSELDPSTPLNSGETIRLRIVPEADGVISVLESGHALAQATLQHGQSFTTPPLPFTGSGTRQLSLVYSPAAVAAAAEPVKPEAESRDAAKATAPALQWVVPLTLTYR
jgi:hypothetical protein